VTGPTGATGPGNIVTSVTITPVTTGILVATGLVVALTSSAGGDTATLTVSHGASPSTPDYIGVGVTVPGPSGTSNGWGILVEYGTTFSGSLAAFPLGTPVQVNLGLFSANGTVYVPVNGAQFNVHEAP
jgi:hypothetical protein